MADSAGDYLRRGLSIIALTGKTPNVSIHKRGIYDCLKGAPESEDDWALIYRALNHRDTTGIGILTGLPYVVVDIDGEEGAEQWAEVAGADYLTDRWVAKTGRGLHLWYNPGLSLLVPSDDGFVGPGTIKLGPKLDLKGFGGYVAAPPSRHPDGGVYEWLAEPGDEPPFEVPKGLARLIEEHIADLRMAIEAKDVRRNAWGPRWEWGDHVYYAQAGHDSLIAGMKTAHEGNRNAYLHWAAATLAEEGGVEDDFEQLYSAALANGLTSEESTRTIRSARRAHG